MTTITRRRGELQRIADEEYGGEPIAKLVPRMVEQEGSARKAALRLGVSRETIRYWMKKLGYQANQSSVSWVKEAQS